VRVFRVAGLLLACWLGTIIIDGDPGVGAAPALTPDHVASLLESLHADYRLYIGTVRYGAGRLRPATLYAGLVRHGGLDPRDPEDVPQTGHGVLNDLIIFSDTFEPWRSAAWRLLLVDHEYFHARHFARGFDIPLVGFGDQDVDRHYHEALAWGWVSARAAAGVYGTLSLRERAEIRARHREHHGAFRRFVMARQPTAWVHYGRFIRDPDETFRSAASAPEEEPARVAGSERE
jgi:hypothetical protein